MCDELFIASMRELIKWEDYEPKRELLTLLRNASITFIQSTTYTRKPNQYWESAEMRLPIPLLKEGRKYLEVFSKIVHELYVETSDYALHSLQIKPKLIEIDNPDVIEHDVVFNQIQETIIQGIRSSKYLIWIAVAWITDRAIYNELLSKKSDGVDIKIIISDESGNDSLMSELDESFELYKVPMSGYYGNNRMHDKFCIIDLEYVLHGSYNWSNAAQYNDETLATALDKDFVCKFADEFLRLKNANG